MQLKSRITRLQRSTRVGVDADSCPTSLNPRLVRFKSIVSRFQLKPRLTSGQTSPDHADTRPLSGLFDETYFCFSYTSSETSDAIRSSIKQAKGWNGCDD